MNDTRPDETLTVQKYMLTLSSPTTTGKVNLKELAEVDTHHLPPVALRFSCMTQLRREAQTIKARHPRLTEEVDFRLAVEAQRRNLTFMQIAH